jgi:HSP20 family molecular chaperone IbpA
LDEDRTVELVQGRGAGAFSSLGCRASPDARHAAERSGPSSGGGLPALVPREQTAPFQPSFPASKRHPNAAALLRPNIDISEGKKAYTVRAELPGVELEDVSIECDGQTLAIRAEKRVEHEEEEEEGYHCMERSYGFVQRILSLPDDADTDAIDARFKNGVLKLRIPKQPARTSRGRSIEIQGA